MTRGYLWWYPLLQKTATSCSAVLVVLLSMVLIKDAVFVKGETISSGPRTFAGGKRKPLIARRVRDYDSVNLYDNKTGGPSFLPSFYNARRGRVATDYRYPYLPKFTAHPFFDICRIEDFTFDEQNRIGKGGFGQVFQATHKSGRIVAIKFISAKSIQEKPKHVEHEETIHRILAHPNIGQLYCSMRNEKNDVFFVLEYFNGGNLLKQLPLIYPLARAQLVKYMGQIISALRFMHSYCIVYRDLKAENIMIDDNDNIRLIDFGLSVYDCNNELSNFAGTMEYVAPEAVGRKKHGRASDIYSAGILLYLLQTQKLPYKRNNQDKQVFSERIAKGELEIALTGDQTVDNLISILTEFDQAKRWQNFHTDFETFKKHPFFDGFDWNSVIDEPVYNIPITTSL